MTLAEFLEFIGPSRDRNSGALTTLKKKCCWRTTCTKVRKISFEVVFVLITFFLRLV